MMLDFIQKLPAKLDERGLIWKWNHKMSSLVGLADQLKCKNDAQVNIFPSLSSLKQAEWSICFKPHSFGRWQRWQRSETGFCATWLSKVSERNSVEGPINPTPGEQPKTKVKHSPQSLQSEFHPDQSFRNWESLKDSSIYHSLNYRSIIFGG